MVGRRLAWLLLVYVTLDFANPLMPGAVNFGAEDSVEGVHAERVRADGHEIVAVPLPSLFGPACPESDRASRLPPEPRPADREPLLVRRALTRPPDPASAADDH